MFYKRSALTWFYRQELYTWCHVEAQGSFWDQEPDQEPCLLLGQEDTVVL